jgi:biopolymer transport protein ExbD
MHHRVLVNIASILVLASGTQACSSNVASNEFRVRVTEHGSCEVGGERVSCASVGSKVLSLCPSKECNVLIVADAHSKSELVVVAFKSLTELRFASVTFAAGSKPQ